jgi:hypothetical protein
VAEQARDDLDAGEWIGRIEWNLDCAKAGLDEDSGDRIGFVGADAAQDCDERRRCQLEAQSNPPS